MNELFKNREEAANGLSDKIAGISLSQPVVLAIPRGGVVLGAILAKRLGAELDVIVARKLRSPWSSELAIGALAEGGRSYLNPIGKRLAKENPEYLEKEIQEQTEEIEIRCSRLRVIQPRASWKNRSVILVDDGMATGATFFAALEVIRAEKPLEIIAALPVLPRTQIGRLRKRSDKVIYLEAPLNFEAVGQFYDSFEPVTFEEVERLLKDVKVGLKFPQPPN
jgi:putative phosphoribosyl transferase